LFSFTWHPYAIDPAVDYSTEPTTLVEFTLEPDGGGTVVTLTESGFDGIPKERRFEAFRMNDNGWTIQMTNIKRHVPQPACAPRPARGPRRRLCGSRRRNAAVARRQAVQRAAAVDLPTRRRLDAHATGDYQASSRSRRGRRRPQRPRRTREPVRAPARISQG